MMGNGAWRSTHYGGTAVQFVSPYGSSAASYTQLIKAIRHPALSGQGARSGLLSLEAVSRPLAPAGSHVIPVLVDGVR